MKARYITTTAIIAALYAALTLIFQPISFGPMQVRISEGLCILPFFSPAAIPGLFIGCLIANIFGSNLGLLDILVGSGATLLSAFLASKMKKKWLVPLPAVVINALAVGLVLNIVLGLPYFVNVLYVGIGQSIACFGIGLPLMFLLNKYKNRIFKKGLI